MSHRSVVMFCPTFRPHVGGAERQAEKLARALADTGVRVTILTPRIDETSPAVEEDAGVRVERFRCRDLSRSVPLRGIGLVNGPALLWQIARAVYRRLGGGHVLHCHIGSIQSVAAALAGRMRGLPVLCKAATASDRSDIGEMEAAGPTGWLVARLSRHVIDRWVATTRDVEEALVRAGVRASSIVRIPNGVEIPAHGGSRAADGVRRFLYLGRISTNSRRNVSGLLRAFERVAAEHGDLELALVGGGDLLEAVRAEASSSRAADRIQLPGFADGAPWLEWADCFILPSTMEGLSNALLEAMAAGLPCIAGDVPANREVLADGRAGDLVDSGSEEEIAAAIRRMVAEPGHAQHMSAAAQRHVRALYGMAHIAQRYMTLYEDLLRDRKDDSIDARAGTRSG